MDCAICQENGSGEIVQTDCNHSFHINCIARWVVKDDTCPLCRKDNPCGVKTYYYTWTYYRIYGTIAGYVYDPYQYHTRVEITHLHPGCFTVFRKDFGGDTDTIPLEQEEDYNGFDEYDQMENAAYYGY